MNKQCRKIKNIGPYVIGRTIGKGLLGKIKICKHSLTDQNVAIKIFKKHELRNESDLIILEREIHILKKLKHKNIIQIFETIQTHSHFYIVMELVEEDILNKIIEKKKFHESEALNYFQQIISSLEYLHHQNIAHRDLKPENILIDDKKSIKLSNFGLATMYNQDRLLNTRCGTKFYTSPEILRGEDYQGETADVWSIGVILYQMLTGFLPFSGDNENEYINNLLQNEISYPSEISFPCQDLLRNILQKDPIKRYRLEDIVKHEWYVMIKPTFYKGINIGMRIPVDENILHKIEEICLDKELTRKKLKNNEFDHLTACYYLLVRKIVKEGHSSVSDFSSNEFIGFASDQTDLDDSKSSSSESIEFSIEKEKLGNDRWMGCRSSLKDYFIKKSVDFEEFKGEMDQKLNEENNLFPLNIEKQSYLKKKSLFENNEFSIKMIKDHKIHESYSDISVDELHISTNCQICQTLLKQDQLLLGNEIYKELRKNKKNDSSHFKSECRNFSIKAQSETNFSIQITKNEEINIEKEKPSYDENFKINEQVIKRILNELQTSFKCNRNLIKNIKNLKDPTVKDLIEALNENESEKTKEKLHYKSNELRDELPINSVKILPQFTIDENNKTSSKINSKGYLSIYKKKEKIKQIEKNKKIQQENVKESKKKDDNRKKNR
jgi:5'-AMP-activated protein kinase catalytic alpha subunit